MIEYDKIILIIYINTYKDTYNFTEVKDYLGFSFHQLDNFIDEIIIEGLLEYNQDYILKVSNSGIDLLKTINLENVSFEDLLMDYSEKVLIDIQTGVKLGINEIYLPEKFQEKFKGYNK
jgi:hypothetical protein